MNRRLATGLSFLVLVMPFVIVSCSSGELKMRQEQRDRIVQSSKIYCEFVNGDNNPDIDVAVNIAMGAKCESTKDFSLVNYRTPSEINGVLFCCSTKEPKQDTLPELPSRKDSIKVSPKSETEFKGPLDVPAAIAAPVPTPTPAAKAGTGVRVTPNKPAATPTPAAPAPAATPAAAVAPAAPAQAAKTKVDDRKPNTTIQFEAEPEAAE